MNKNLLSGIFILCFALTSHAAEVAMSVSEDGKPSENQIEFWDLKCTSASDCSLNRAMFHCRDSSVITLSYVSTKEKTLRVTRYDAKERAAAFEFAFGVNGDNAKCQVEFTGNNGIKQASCSSTTKSLMGSVFTRTWTPYAQDYDLSKKCKRILLQGKSSQ